MPANNTSPSKGRNSRRTRSKYLATASSSLGRQQLSPRQAASRENGRKGGLATTQKYGSQFVQARGAKGGQATRELYGRDYYSYISKMCKTHRGWPKGRLRKLNFSSKILAVMVTRT
jgi:hypothetical protein